MDSFSWRSKIELCKMKVAICIIVKLAFNPLSASPTQTIRRQIPDELFESVWPFCGIGPKKAKLALLPGGERFQT